METASLLVWAFLALACASPAPRRKADEKFLHKQNDLLQLFVNVQQPNYNQQQKQLGDSFDLDKQQHEFSRVFAVKQFNSSYKQGLLPRGEIFLYYNAKHLQQAIQLFDIFYFAKKYDTFYQAACWARERVNEGQFTYALSVAIAKRQDTQGVALPPQSEVYPFLYVNAQAVREAQNAKQQGVKAVNVFSPITGFDPYNSNYNNRNQYNYDAKVSYFREDKDLNQLFAYQQIHYPSWFHEEKYGYKWSKTNGERFYYYLQLILARYNLERYSNDLPYVQPIQFNEDIQPGYNPQLLYNNGQAVPPRPNNVNFNNANLNNQQQLLNLDRRIADAVDSRQVIDVTGENIRLSPDSGAAILGDLVQSNTRAVNRHFYSVHGGLYGYLDLFRVVVARTFNQGPAPSAIESEGSALRDPVFYQILARLVSFLQDYKNQQQPYKQEQINFQGVEVQSVNVDQLETYFDNSEVDLYNAISYKQGEQAEQFHYKAKQQRLNNKPFNYNIQVNSEQNTDAIVRVFIGPQYDVQSNQYSLEQARQNFVEIDRFVANLKKGQNAIKRSSQQSSIFTEEQPGTRSVIAQVREALQGGNPFYVSEGHDTQQPSFPQNLILPKGTKDGQPFVLLVAVNSYEPSEQKFGQNVNPPDDGRAQGFPLDRPVTLQNFKGSNNFHFKNVTIFNKRN